MVEFLQTAVGLGPLAHPGPIDCPCGAIELCCRIFEPAVVVIFDQRLLVRGETFERLTVQLAVAADAFACRQFRNTGREWSGIEAQYGFGETLEKAPPAVPCQPWPAGHSG